MGHPPVPPTEQPSSFPIGNEKLEARNYFSYRPVFRQIFSYLLVFGVVAVLRTQALERRNDFLLADFERIGDHTRGLFEADASIAASAAHPSQDVKIFFLVGHFILSGIVDARNLLQKIPLSAR